MQPIKWYKRIDVVAPSLAFFFFILLSYRTREEKWWPELFMMIAGAALSIVIVLKIIEVWSRKERIQRWEKVKNLIYSRILKEFQYIAHTIALYGMKDFDKPPIDSSELLFNSDKLCSNMMTLALHTRDQSLKLVSNHYMKNKDDSSELLVKTIDIEFLNFVSETIIDSINDYKEMVPRAIELPDDDEELGFGLLRFEASCSLLLSSLETRKLLKPSEPWKQAYHTLSSFAIFLRDAVDICELIQQKNVAKPVKNWRKELTQRLKYWWLPPEFWE